MLDVVGASKSVASFMAGLAEDDLRRDEKLRSPVLFQLLIIGKAVKRPSDSFRMTHEDVPWKRIAGMRDRLIHGYDDFDDREVWHAVTKDVPRLVHRLAPLIPSRTTE
ncbi:MAG: DUF86 domain-containing protein [Alphaproteobacteria bacterium]|nr:DUF86 domain-containing protein [Alphaproteobacteria bacterium]